MIISFILVTVMFDLEVMLLGEIRCWSILGSKGYNLKSDQHVISPYSDTAESFIKIRRVKEMITNLRIFDC